jgi:hypothetical protein
VKDYTYFTVVNLWSIYLTEKKNTKDSVLLKCS